MADTIEPLVADLVEWVGRGRRYSEVMDAWKTSCPRLPIWEEANARGLLARRRGKDGTEWVHLTPAGQDLIAKSPLPPPAGTPCGASDRRAPSQVTRADAERSSRIAAAATQP